MDGYEQYAEYDTKVELDVAKNAIEDWDSFIKRNRINPDTDAIYLDKIKNENDRSILTPLSTRNCTGWIKMEKVPADDRNLIISLADEENIFSEWDNLSFDEMGDMCANCPLSWDKGRGCIGAFGPDNSLLPSIAAKHGCTLVASVPEAAKNRKIFTSSDAETLLKEVEILKQALPEEGKMMVRRYSGPVDRMEAVAKISRSENCGFFFF